MPMPTISIRLRSAAACLLCLLLQVSPVYALTKSWNFQVYLGDKPIGFQHFQVDDDGDSSSVSISARFEVKVFSFTVYHYTHDATEQWQKNCLRMLSAQTDDNGDRQHVTTEITASGIVATGTGGRVTLGECPMSFAYWNPLMLQQSQLLNSQTGEWQRVNIAELGKEKIQVRGAAIDARHYRINGLKQPIDLWYSFDGEWLALAAKVSGGRILRYQLN
jgi:hypothetical protein